MRILTNYSKLTALVIDDMMVQQTTLRGQLASLGIGKVDAAGTVEDALRLIKSRSYGLILCDYNLNQKTDGQQLFEYLRDNGLLPLDCLFFMVTAENAYSSVASATEHKPDAYLLKPITAVDIEERLKNLIERRDAMAGINERMAQKDLAGALAECDKALLRKDRWFIQVMQIKGDMLLQLGRHEDARALYHQALDLRANLVWAQLGLAKAHKAGNNLEEAKMLAQEIINSPGGEKNVAAYDVVAQSLEAQGDAYGALWMLRDAATVVPSAKRQRLVGESAYRNGDLEMAKECFVKVAKSTKGSVTANPQDTLSLAQTLVDKGDLVESAALLTEAASAQRHNPVFESVANAIRAQQLVKSGDLEGAAKMAARARENLRQPKADFATIALAKAEIMTGNETAGFKLLQAAVSADHENPRVKQLIGNALRETGHEDKLAEVVEAATQGLTAKVSDAKALFRNSRIDEALASIEAAVKEYPENTGVLLQAAQMNCMSLRLKKQLNSAVSERVRMYLTRLDKLMPSSDRVTQMRRYYSETLKSLATPATV
jgi:CheY-like chemotaxis protein